MMESSKNTSSAGMPILPAESSPEMFDSYLTAQTEDLVRSELEIVLTDENAEFELESRKIDLFIQSHMDHGRKGNLIVNEEEEKSNEYKNKVIQCSVSEVGLNNNDLKASIGNDKELTSSTEDVNQQDIEDRNHLVTENDILLIFEKLNIMRISSNVNLVSVTHINNPHDFYVRLYVPGIAIENIFSIIPNQKPDMALGNIVMYKSKLNSKCIRGQIVKVIEKDDRTCFDVKAIDVGIIEECITEGDIFAGKFINRIPALAMKCTLFDCEPRNGKLFDDEATNAMKHFVRNYVCNMWVVNNCNDKLTVRLSNELFGSIAKIMALSGYTCLGWISKPKNVKVQIQTATYTTLYVDNTYNVKLLIVNQNNFFVAKFKDYEELNEYDKSIDLKTKLIGKKMVSSGLIVGKCVAVLSTFNKKTLYRRAIIKETIEDIAKVQLLDSGIIMNVNVYHIMTLPPEFIIKPAMAIYCKAANIDDTNIRDNGKGIKIKVLERGNDFEQPYLVMFT